MMTSKMMELEYLEEDTMSDDRMVAYELSDSLHLYPTETYISLPHASHQLQINIAEEYETMEEQAANSNRFQIKEVLLMRVDDRWYKIGEFVELIGAD